MKALISLDLFNQRFKMRHFVLAYLFLVSFVVLPGWFEIDKDWKPYGSIEDQSIAGYSDVGNRVNSLGIDIKTTTMQLNELNLQERSTALVIFQKRERFSNEDIEFLRQRAKRNLPTLYVGSHTEFSEITDYPIEIDRCHVYDKNNENGVISHVPSTSLDLKVQFTSIAPLPLVDYGHGDPNEEIEPLLTTLGSVKACFKDDLNTEKPNDYVISIKHRNQIWLSDGFFLTNNFTRQYPENLDVLPYLLQQFEIPITQMVVFERYLRYIPVNQEALLLSLEYNFRYVPIVPIGLILLALPLAVSVSSGLFKAGSQTNGNRETKLSKRLTKLHTDRLPAVPLSLEEKILVKEQFTIRQLGADYFRKVAAEYLNFIRQENLGDIVPDSLIQSLERLMLDRYSPSTAWTVLEKVQFLLDIIEDNPLFVQGILSMKDEEKTVSSIFDHPIFSSRASEVWQGATSDFFIVPQKIEEEVQDLPENKK